MIKIDNIDYILVFGLSFLFTALLTNFVKRYALSRNIVDVPNSERKIHTKPIPLLGGVAVYISFIVSVIFYSFIKFGYFEGYMRPKYIIGVGLAGLLIIIGGYLDDKYNLSPSRQIIWPILAAVVIILSGIGIDHISNPLGEALNLKVINIQIFEINNTPYYFTPLADFFTFLWLMGMMYTTKILDGLDGLVSGISIIGAVILFFLSLTPTVMQPETALLCIVLAGSFMGFLIYNFHPASIFLGEGGGLFAGLMLGVLAIISGGKIATALLILGIPMLDMVWVIARRLWQRKSPFASADRKHLHHRLLDIGLSHRKAVLILYLISAVFGSTALFVEGRDKVIVLVILGVFMTILGIFLVIKYRKRLTKSN